MASRPFFKPFVTIPVAPLITGIIIHFMFHFRFSSVHKLLCFNHFSASCVSFLSAATATCQYACFSFFVLFLIIISVLFAVTSLCILIPLFYYFIIIIIVIVVVVVAVVVT